MRIYHLLVWGVVTLPTFSQSTPKSVGHQPLPSIPAYRIEAIANSGFTIPSLGLIGEPPYCFDGDLWADQLTKDGRHVFTRIGRDGKLTNYDPAAQSEVIAPGNLYTLRAADVTHDAVTLFIDGTRSKEQKTHIYTLPNGTTQEVKEPAGTIQAFALIFDRDGTFKESVPLASEYNLHGAARFPTGEFLEVAVDPVNQLPIVAVFNHQGELEKVVQLPKQLDQTSTAIGNADKDNPDGVSDSEKLNWAMDLVQFVHLGNSILLIQPGTPHGIVSISSDGFAQEIIPKVPVSLPLDNAFSTGSSLFVRYGAPGPGASIIFEINPLTGEASREFHLGSAHAWEVSCIGKDSVQMITGMDYEKHTFTFGEGRLLAVTLPKSKN